MNSTVPFRAVSTAALMLTLTSVAFGTGCSGGPSQASLEEEGDTGPSEAELLKKTDAAVTKEITDSTKGTNYTSESDFPFTFVSANLSGEKKPTEALVRAKFAAFVEGLADADKPLSSLNAMSQTFAKWRTLQDDCDDNEAKSECTAMRKMNATIAKDLKNVRVYYFGQQGKPGQVDGTAVSIFIVGITPQGNLAGVHTIAIWT